MSDTCFLSLYFINKTSQKTYKYINLRLKHMSITSRHVHNYVIVQESYQMTKTAKSTVKMCGKCKLTIHGLIKSAIKWLRLKLKSVSFR